MNSLNLTKDHFYKAILDLLDKLGGSASIEEIESHIVEAFEFSDDDLSQTYEKSGALIVPDKISWSRSYLKMAGLVTNARRGVWVLTDEGRNAVGKTNEQIRILVSEAQRQYNLDYRKAKQNEINQDSNNSDESDEPSDWDNELLNKLQSIPPDAFERLCQRLLRESGFTRVEVTGKSGDGGIDGLGVLRVNLVSFHVLFQSKRYKGSVGAPTIRDFRGAMQGRADKGLVITTGTFTPDARREATRDGAPAIDLIDGEALCVLLKDLQLGVRVKEVVTEEILIDSEFFKDL